MAGLHQARRLTPLRPGAALKARAFRKAIALWSMANWK